MMDDPTNNLPKWPMEIVSVSPDIHIFVKASTKEEFRSWLADFEELTKTTYFVRSSKACSGRSVEFTQLLYCQHNSYGERKYDYNARPSSIKRSTKNTNCPSKIKVKIHSKKKYYRKEYKKIGEMKTKYPCEIILSPSHNHSTNSADALRFRKVSDDVKNKLMHLFDFGHSPSSALKSIKMEIQLNHPNDNLILADRKICPDYKFVSNLYLKEYKKNYVPLNVNSEGREFLQERLRTYNNDMGSTCAQIESDDNQNYVICICTPLMKRIHQNMKEASQIVFMDSSGISVDKDGSRVYILLTHSQCGGLPLGVIITSSESVEILSKGFEMLKVLLGSDLFHGNIEGPKIFLTDDSSSEQKAVSDVFPKARLLLSIFLVLQSVRSWLRKSSNIPEDLQGVFYNQFRSIMFAEDSIEASAIFEEAINSAIEYNNYSQYLQTYWDRRKLWTIAYRKRLSSDRNNTNYYSEAGMKLLKDKIFQQVKAFNVAQLVDFVLTKFNQYYEQRLTDAANNRLTQNKIFGKEIVIPSQDLLDNISSLSEHLLMAPSESVDGLYYLVDMAALICTCSDGITGKICKHIDWCSITVYSENYNKNIDSIYDRTLFYIIATGQEPPNEWILPLYKEDLMNDEITITNMDFEHVDNIELQYADEEAVRLTGTELISNISEIYRQFIEKSTSEVVPALQKMYDNLSNIETVQDFVSACSSFGTEHTTRCPPCTKVQPTIIRRKQPQGRVIQKKLALLQQELD